MDFISRTRTVGILVLTALFLTGVHTLVSSLPVEELASASYTPECDDGIDNDLDGKKDYPLDPDCLSPSDDTEDFVEGPVVVIVSDGIDTAIQGESVTYHITVKSENATPTNEVIRFYVPDHVDVLNFSDAGHRKGHYIEWNSIFIHPDTPRTLTVSGRIRNAVTIGTVIFAEAEVVGESLGRDLTEVTEKEEEVLTPLRITVDDGKAFVNADEELHYQIYVENTTGFDREFDLFTHVPPFLTVQNATGDFEKKQRSIEWDDQFIADGETVVYDLYASVERDTPDHTTLKMKVTTGPSIGEDSTTVINIDNFPPGSIAPSVSNGLTEAGPGDEITYSIHLENFNSVLATDISVVNAIPTYTEFVSATEGGEWTGKDVRWKGLTISPQGSRTLHMTLRVRTDAPLGAELKNSVNTEGQVAVDITTVSDIALGNTAPVVMRGTMLRKTADRKVVNPGDIVRYTILLRNTLDHAISNVRVEDRMDPTQLSVLNAEHAQMLGNTVVWELPVLEPGAQWRTTYTARVNGSVPRGTEIANIVTVTGEGLETLSLTERVQTAELSVVRELPRSGAPLDVLLALLLGVVGLVPTAMQRLHLR